LTNVFTGRPARGLLNRLVAGAGPICLEAPPFPLAAGAVAPLREGAEKRGSGDFSPLWAGEAAALAREKSAETLTHSLWTDALAVMRNLNQ
jgi:nitronate monooxygenase